MQTNVIEYLLNSVKKYPNKVAFCDEKKAITFAELDEQARQIAGMLIKQLGPVKNQPIAVYMEKGVNCIAAFMGIVYSGNFYAPIDVRMPKERVSLILNVLKPRMVITDASVMPGMLETEFKLTSEQVVCMEHVDGFKEFCDLERVKREHLDVDPLYVLFTSGSTGTPKGVVISHKSVIDYEEWLAETFAFDEKTVFGNQAPFHFDNSIVDIYQTLRNGAKMIIIPERLFLFHSKLIKFLNQYKVNAIFWVPSALTAVANSGVLEKERITELEKVLFAGEVMPVKQLNEWRKYYPKALYANLYGPTEITDVCTYYIVDRIFSENELLPIGKACRNTEIFVINDEGMLVQEGETGELCVRGTCLSLGYYGEPEKTDAVFVQNPLHKKYRDLIYRTGDIVKYNERGELLYLCRKDSQIKYQGHRIELGEIDSAGYTIEGVRQACTVFDENKIIFFCSLSKELTEKEIYDELKRKVPKYMLPKMIKILDEIPLNANGKLDRVWLRTQC